MIIAQTDKGAGLMGCLDVGSDLVASMRSICVNKNVHCGFISAYGYLQDPRLTIYSRAQKNWSNPQQHEGMYVTASLQGSVSLGEDDQPDVTLFCHLTPSGMPRAKAVAGCLYEAKVLFIEFLITPVEGVTFRRITDESTGLQPWLQMLPAGTHYATPPSTTSLPSLDGVASLLRSVREEQDEDEDEIVLESGDWLNHPRFGMCRVERFDGDERVKVKLASGRVAELLVSMFRLSLGGVRDGARVIEATMRVNRT